MKGNFEIVCCEICELAIIKRFANPVSLKFDCSHEQAKKRAIEKVKTAEDLVNFECPYFKEKTNDKATTQKTQEEKD